MTAWAFERFAMPLHALPTLPAKRIVWVGWSNENSLSSTAESNRSNIKLVTASITGPSHSTSQFNSTHWLVTRKTAGIVGQISFASSAVIDTLPALLAVVMQRTTFAHRHPTGEAPRILFLPDTTRIATTNFAHRHSTWSTMPFRAFTANH